MHRKHQWCMMKWLATLLLLLTSQSTYAQWRMGSLRIVKIPVVRQAWLLDTVAFIAPGSVRVFQGTQEIDPQDYTVVNEKLVWQSIPPQEDSVRVHYRVLSLPGKSVVARRERVASKYKIRPDVNGEMPIDFDFRPAPENFNPFQEVQGLNYNGSLSRGLQVGNNQNLSLNSSFNLQLGGKLGDDLEISAALSDQNIPIQPEGNTARLNELDRVYVQIKKQQHQLTAGDYELGNPASSHFLRFFKKLQGATASTFTDLGSGKLEAQGSLAVARGIFQRYVVPTLEGNQGPYRLQGRNSETFLIVLSGTERVYLDGLLLQRGLENDYIIDYNRAELTFTSRRLITKDSRVVIEFDYATQTYLRSLYTGNASWNHKKGNLRFQVYSEQDNTNTQNNENLDSLGVAALKLAGDNTSLSLGQSLRKLAPGQTVDGVVYRLKDTVVQVLGKDSTFSILTVAEADATEKYRASFISGEGDYILAPELGANGRAYQWVAPDPVTGKSRGNYKPGQRLSPPQQLQVLSAGGQWNLGHQSFISTELALSKLDLNRFSALDDEDNQGLAAITRFQKQWQSLKWGLLRTQAQYEFVSATFRALNPWRNAEFTRDWNLNADASGANAALRTNEHLIGAGVRWESAPQIAWEYRFNYFERKNNLNGWKQEALLSGLLKAWKWQGEASWLQTKLGTGVEGTRFIRPRMDVSYTWKGLQGFQTGIFAEGEDNRRTNGNGLMADNSYSWDITRFYTKMPDSNKLYYQFSVQRRMDRIARSGLFKQQALAYEYIAQGGYRWKQQQWIWTGTWRTLGILAPETTTLQPQRTLLGRLDYQGILFKGGWKLNTNYEIGSGQEPRVEFNYLQVNPGQGVYQWRDYNSDGQQQINEFVLAPFPDSANFVRVVVYTNQFLRTDNASWLMSSLLDGKRWAGQGAPWWKVWKWMALQSNLRIQQKTSNLAGVKAFNVFSGNLPDSLVVAGQWNHRQALWINQGGSWDLLLNFQETRNITTLTAGFDISALKEWSLQHRLTLGKAWTGTLQAATGNQSRDVELFNEQDFELSLWRVEPSLIWQPGQKFRWTHGYKWKRSMNNINEQEAANQHQLQEEAVWNQSAQTSLRASMSWVNMEYLGNRGTPVEFAMLQGLQPGNNFLWQVNMDRTLGKNIQMSASYEGRKTGSVRIIHTGRVTMRAIF